jgi:hypothetical protein
MKPSITQLNVSVFTALLLLLFTGETILATEHAPSYNSSTTTPSHVYVELQRVEQLIDQLSRYMGVQEPDPLHISITNASPHDVYFQARTLIIKANRLSFELIREQNAPPILPGGTIRPAEVKTMITKAGLAISDISREFKILKTYRPQKPQKGITPSDVLKAIMTGNRHLNALLEKRFAAEEVYQVVTLAISYASNLLAEHSGAVRIPKKPGYIANKRPLDVYYRLYKCLQLIIQIYKIETFDILEIDISSIQEKNIIPSDVFDMASLVVARLDYLYKKKHILRVTREAYFPGRKFPSDVYQQTAILEQQLTALLSYEKRKQQPDGLQGNE